jgi:Tfp pilus assembly protein FimT
MSAIEMLAAVTIFGILSSTATAKLSRYTEQQRISKAVTALGSDFQLAYQLAARNRVQIVLRPNAKTPDQFEIVSDPTKATVTVFSRRRLEEYGVTAETMVAQVSMVNAADKAPISAVTFYPNGTSSHAVTITLKGKLNTNYSRTVSISRTGLMKYE